MKNRTYLIFLLFYLMQSNGFAQNSTIELTFSADSLGQEVLLDSVYVKNLYQNCDTVLYPPNLILEIDTLTTGISSVIVSENSLVIYPNYPNPIIDKSFVKIYVPERISIKIKVSNLLGQSILNYSGQLSKGTSTFEFTSGRETVYFLTVEYNGISKSIKMISPISSTNECTLSFKTTDEDDYFKTIQIGNEFCFAPGDRLLFAGYSYLGESGLLDIPSADSNYEFQFATNVPCPGLDSLYYKGKYYHTIQIFSQCWIKENMDVGIMIQSAEAQTNNNIIEKYCMGDYEPSCNIFGGLYFWNEMMTYTNETGGQGICPEGWHVPEDMEWQILEGAVDSNYRIGDPLWMNNSFRGSDVGGNLKQKGTTLWQPPNTGATDAFGFMALPAGYFVQNAFWGPEYKAYLWTSEYPQKYYRNMDWNQAKVRRNDGGNEAAFSVRCVKD